MAMIALMMEAVRISETSVNIYVTVSTSQKTLNFLLATLRI
jgi:hypothetical protein